MDLVYTSDDGTVKEDNPLVEFFDKIVPAAQKFGCDLRIITQMPNLLEAAGFENVRTEVYKLPMGPWPKDKRLKHVGLFHRHQFLQGLSGIAIGLLTRALGWERSEVELYLVFVRQAIEDRRIHGYWRVYYVTASTKTGNPA